MRIISSARAEQGITVFPNLGQQEIERLTKQAEFFVWENDLQVELEYRFCRKVSEGVFETVFFAEHQVDPTAAEPWRLTFGVKFMHQRTWGNEEGSQNYTMPNSYLYSPSPNDKGNFNGTDDFANLPGIYRFTINMNNKTTSFVKIK